MIGHGVKNLLGVLKKGYDYSGNRWVDDQSFMALFAQMLNMHPGQRISPEEILEHSFLEFESKWAAKLWHIRKFNLKSS